MAVNGFTSLRTVKSSEVTECHKCTIAPTWKYYCRKIRGNCKKNSTSNCTGMIQNVRKLGSTKTKPRKIWCGFCTYEMLHAGHRRKGLFALYNHIEWGWTEIYSYEDEDKKNLVYHIASSRVEQNIHLKKKSCCVFSGFSLIFEL